MPLCMNFEYNNSFGSVPSVAIANYSTKQCSQQLDNFSQTSRHRLAKKTTRYATFFLLMQVKVSFLSSKLWDKSVVIYS